MFPAARSLKDTGSARAIRVNKMLQIKMQSEEIRRDKLVASGPLPISSAVGRAVKKSQSAERNKLLSRKTYHKKTAGIFPPHGKVKEDTPVSEQPGWGHSALCHPPSQTDSKTGRQLPLTPSHVMEALYMQPFEEVLILKEQEQEKSGRQEEEGIDASDEETDEDSEPEPPSVSRRKVSFADAFGLDLVSVKEFDDVEVTGSEVTPVPESEGTLASEEFYMSSLFAVPSCAEELDHRLQAQMVELESIELLPGTTTLRGIIRVVNLSYSKSVYARITFDRWTSYIDLLAEYVPGSSDRKTDRFTFQYHLIPSFEKEGTRVEFCLRYETSVGTFWANNHNMNYVLFCHQRGHVQEQGPQVQEESSSYRSKRSCLRANRRGSAQEKALETSYTSTVLAEGGAAHRAQEADIKTKDGAKIQSVQNHGVHKALVDSIKRRHRAARLARVQERLAQRRQQVPKAYYSHDSAEGQELSQRWASPWCDSASILHKRQKKRSSESPQVLTYHQIPLLTLDWNDDKIQKWGSADVDDIWTGGTKITLSKASVEDKNEAPSVGEMWETFHNGTDDTTDKGSSVCEVWQAFLNGASCTDHSGVPESEWLQTATSVSPSNDKKPKAQFAVKSENFRGGKDPPTTLNSHTSAVCQLLSDSFQTPLAFAALNVEDHQPAEACVSSRRDDKPATQEAPQRSQTNSVTDMPQEFSLKGATLVSEGSVDGSTECHEHAKWEREKEGIIGSAEGKGRDVPLPEDTDDFVTSSGESVTTDLTETPESPNASAVDRISQGAKLDGGLSYSGESEVTGTADNAMDDTLAFRGTIKQGTKDGERFVFPTSRQGEEKGIMNNSTANSVSTQKEVFRPQETEGCEISQRYADEKHHEEFRLNQNRENPLQRKEGDENETRPAQSHPDELNPNQTCEDNLKQSQRSEFRLDESEKDGVFEKTRVETSHRTDGETKRAVGAGTENSGVSNVEACQHVDKALKLNSHSTSIKAEVYRRQSRPMQAREEPCDLENVGLKSETDEYAFIPNQEDEGLSLSCDEIIGKPFDITPSAQTDEPKEIIEVFCDHYTLRTFPIEVVEMKWNFSQDDLRGQKEDGGNETRREVMAKESVAREDNSTELQRQPELLEIIEEDMSQGDKDERESIGKLKIEAQGELMGNVENPQGERKNAPAGLEEQELSAEVESSPRVECKKLSEGTKEPIKAESTEALEVIESGLIVERFGEDLVQTIWEEVFDWKVQVCKRDTGITDEMEGEQIDLLDMTQNCHLLFEKDSDDAFDSGVFSLIESPTDPSLSVCQGLEQTSTFKSNDCFSRETKEPLSTAEQTHLILDDSQAQTDSNSSTHLSQDLNPILAAKSWQSLTDPAQSSPKDQENYPQMKERSVLFKEAIRPTEEWESWNQSASHPAHRVQSSSSEKSKESNRLEWWGMLHILSHITRLIICIIFVAGFFYIVFLYDLPSFIALNIFSLCCWFSQWKRHRVTTDKRMVG
ncbi:uncharacterized protein ppp1r3aa isoform X1 [Xyrichtys novacula]|uniref:Uncharacterized protein ppp1r3aa isoform X1 n=1 Tax=Xyrichtys novacula TaxID=13765 RepID=A0AAV1F259_XYRNO|nr:uncharacterized protein ppp1r3aa isoform X1 [Xyrichtys novacula]